eukprot:6468418-Alexandrium_andersonii.AAC.1
MLENSAPPAQPPVLGPASRWPMSPRDATLTLRSCSLRTAETAVAIVFARGVVWTSARCGADVRGAMGPLGDRRRRGGIRDSALLVRPAVRGGRRSQPASRVHLAP